MGLGLVLVKIEFTNNCSERYHTGARPKYIRMYHCVPFPLRVPRSSDESPN